MKNILLLFLSEMHLQTDHQVCVTAYHRPDGGEDDCIQTNESAVRYMLQNLAAQGQHLNAIFFFSTRKMKTTIQIRETQGNLKTMTHEQCFVQQILSICPQLKGALYPIAYDETNSTEDSIRQVACMAGRIRQFQQDTGDLDITLHADMTGGFRHAAMMMLSVMQLLRYSGIQIGRVLYSNFKQRQVEDVTAIHQMFSLISGTDEFINFGSVKEIETYFKDKKVSPSLQSLLAAMHDFADAIRICRTNAIEPLLKKLKHAIDNFCQLSDKTLEEQLFFKSLTL